MATNDRTPVIVATHSEDVVRVYVGFPRNGGMDQTGQFALTRPIAPTDLANMSVDLANVFGWLEIEPHTKTEPPALAPAYSAPPAVVPLPAAKAKKKAGVHKVKSSDKWQQRVKCPECDYVGRRKNVHSHLVNVHHWSRTKASDVLRDAPAVDEAKIDAIVNAPDVLPEPPTRPTESFWKTVVACPECNAPHRRSNVIRHLTGGKHSYRHTDAVAAAKEARPHDAPPEPTPTKRPSRGIAGRARIEREDFPAILRLAKRGPVGSASVAEALKTNRSSAVKYLAELAQRGALVEIPRANENEPRRFQLVTT